MKVWLEKNFPSLEHEFIISDEGIVLGLFLQDAEMKSMFARFPEFLLCDATYKTNLKEMPTFAFQSRRYPQTVGHDKQS